MPPRITLGLVIIGISLSCYFLFRDTSISSFRRYSGYEIPENARFLPYSYHRDIFFGGDIDVDMTAEMDRSAFLKFYAEAKSDPTFKALPIPEETKKEMRLELFERYPLCKAVAKTPGSNNTDDHCAPDYESEIAKVGIFRSRIKNQPPNYIRDQEVILFDAERNRIRVHISYGS